MRLNIYLTDEVGEEFQRLFPPSTRSGVVRCLLRKAVQAIKNSDDPVALAGDLIMGTAKVEVKRGV